MLWLLKTSQRIDTWSGAKSSAIEVLNNMRTVQNIGNAETSVLGTFEFSGQVPHKVWKIQIDVLGKGVGIGTSKKNILKFSRLDDPRM